MKERISYCALIKYSWINYIHPNQHNLFFVGPKIKREVEIITKYIFISFCFIYFQGQVPITP